MSLNCVVYIGRCLEVCLSCIYMHLCIPRALARAGGKAKTSVGIGVGLGNAVAG